MNSAEEANAEIWEALAAHFRRSAEHLTPEQIADMTAYDLATVEHALGIFYNNGQIDGMTVMAHLHPVVVTKVIYN